MTEPELTLEERELAEAKEAAKTPPQPVPDSADLPDDVQTGDPDQGATTTVTITGDDMVVTEGDA